MALHSINESQRLYVIKAGSGFTCYGFDVLDRKARALALWIAAPFDPAPAVGTEAHYTYCQNIMQTAAKFAADTGERCGAELVPSLVGLEGKRIECDYFGERIRFRVGKSTGWLPCHLRIRTSRSNGGEALFADEVSNVRVIGA